MEGRNRTISLFYEAAVNPALWPRALAAFADLTQCPDVMLTVIDKKRGQPRLFLSGCRMVTPDTIGAYVAHYYKVESLPRRVDLGKQHGFDCISGLTCP